MEFKTQEQVLTDLIDHTQSITPKLTDYNVGSVVRSIYDAMSIETESLYGLTIENINEGIELGLMQSFDFNVKEPQPAYGDVTIEFNSPVVSELNIPKGTAFVTDIVGDTNRYVTTKSYNVPMGVQTVVVQATAEQAGVAGNVDAMDINAMATNLYNVARVYNKEAFTTGDDGETYEQVKRRFALFIESIGRATKNAIKYGALSIQEVKSVYVTEQVGLVTVYVADNNGNLPPETKEKVATKLEDYRAAGIELRVMPMEKVNVDNTVILTLDNRSMPDADYIDQTSRIISRYINSLGAGQDLIINDLVKTIFNSNDRDFYDVDVEYPEGNIKVEPNQILRAGTSEITVKMKGDA
jgi:hypothetical protein